MKKNVNVTEVYNDSIIAIGLINTNKKKKIFHLAIKYVEPRLYTKNGKSIPITNIMGGETNWFLLPHTFAAGIVKILIELKVSGMNEYFNERGFEHMIKYFVEMEYINDVVAY